MSGESGLHTTTFPVNSLRTRSRASRILYLFKGISAIGLMIYHLRVQLFANGDELFQLPLGTALFYLLTSIGSTLLMILFVIDGYRHSASLLREIQNEGWSWTAYLSRGFVRLWSLLLPALLLTWLWGTLSADFFGSAESGFGSLDGKTFFGNLLFLQGILTDSFGSNLPLWILSCEFWFYVLFACLVQIYFAEGKWRKAIYLALAAAIGWFIGISTLAYFAVWLLGGLLAVLPVMKIRSKRVRTMMLTGSTLLLSLVLLWNGFLVKSISSHLLAGYLSRILVALASAIVLYLVLCFHNRTKRVTPFRVDQGVPGRLARLAYPLYLTHMPVLMFLAAWLGYPAWEPTPIRFAYFLVVCIGLVLYAWLIGRFTETIAQRFKCLAFAILRSLGFSSQALADSSQKPNRRESRSHSTKLLK